MGKYTMNMKMNMKIFTFDQLEVPQQLHNKFLLKSFPIKNYDYMFSISEHTPLKNSSLHLKTIYLYNE